MTANSTSAGAALAAIARTAASLNAPFAVAARSSSWTVFDCSRNGSDAVRALSWIDLTCSF